jgi:hypothetical protein
MAAPILRGNGQSGQSGQSGHTRRRTYALISSSAFASPHDATLAALSDPRNSDGSLIDVVLISDKGSEGITVKCAREIHVLEPWFHMNKLEQVVGRGSRFCSHSLLPRERQNLTVYYHAMQAVNAKSETLDLYMYRAAARKQRGIAAIETILKQHAFDCNIHAFYHKRVAQLLRNQSRSMRTSQGRVITGTREGDPGRIVQCRPTITDIGSNTKVTEMDMSTYDPNYQAHSMHHYTDAIKSFYSEPTDPSGPSEPSELGTQRVSGTYEQIWAYVVQYMSRVRGAHVRSNEKSMNYALHRMLLDRTTLRL